jgi:hypothetical protein
LKADDHVRFVHEVAARNLTAAGDLGIGREFALTTFARGYQSRSPTAPHQVWKIAEFLPVLPSH